MPRLGPGRPSRKGADFDYFRLVFSTYRALRRAGLSVDILPPDTADLSPYRLVLAPGLATLSDPLLAALAGFGGKAILGPRTNAKTRELAIPVPLPPNLPGLDTTVAETSSLPPQIEIPVTGGGSVRHWLEALEGTAETEIETETGAPVLVTNGTLSYLAGWPDPALWDRIVRSACDALGLPAESLPDGLRLRDTATHRFAFNYGNRPVSWNGHDLPAAGVAWWPRDTGS